MKITVVCDVLGEENNGTTIAAMNLIRHLSSRGHEVRILCADKDKKGHAGCYVVPNRSFGPLDPYLASNGVTLAKPDREIVREAIAGADIVHVMLPFSLGLSAAKEAHAAGIPLSAGCHLLAENFSVHVFMKKSHLVNRLAYVYFNRLYKWCDSVHYVTQYIRDLYESMYGKTNGYVISNGVNEIFFPKEEEGEDDGMINILYTGRYSKEKSHKTLIRAVKYSAHKDRIRLIFAGDGPMKKKLERMARKLPVPPVFRFFTREEMVHVNRRADLYVHAAEYEAEGIGCLEALATGVVPVICDSPKSATRFYALDEKSLFRAGDAKELARKIDWWLDHPEEKAEYSKKYAQMAREKFDHTACMDAMEHMLEETVRRVNEKRA